MSDSTALSAEDLIAQYGGIALDKQNDLSALIGNNNWNADLNEGVISFGDQLTFPIQILGTFSHSSETFLWGWANTQSNIPENLLQQAAQLKAYGEAHQLPLFTTSQFDGSVNDVHYIGLIASGMFDASAYYVADYGSGALLVTIQSDVIDKTRTDAPQRVLTVFPQLISLFEMDHQQALSSYLNAKAFQVTTKDKELSATYNGSTIVATFDELSRLASLNGTLS
ncbi:hypothetical protein SAMN04488128_106456 [Chitinophaga eiseniae]|uniref:Uncharacterized protein n=1 Tax=Chitinophaga eiseniae TaxID=634771 RepID=A0A1T4TW40_9BACT|nr:DUF6882 domain-containing protein [Chitinophaga eiseniae]SKA44650.1 hypothetical protein SAMN04488128_106456 [Chitinophaga eiseniae]